MIKKIILLFLCVVNFSAITILSTQNADKSNELSKSVTEKIVSPITSEIKIEEKTLIDNNMTRNIAHFALFLTLSVVLSLTFKNFNVKQTFLYSFIICFVFAILDEAYQEILKQGRVFEFADLLKDWAGSIIGIYTICFAHKLTNKV